MHALSLLVPSVNEAIAVHLLDRSPGPAIAGSTEWNGSWQHIHPNYGDAAAWALVAFFLLTLGVVAGCIIALRTRPPGPTREHLLIDEVLRNEDSLAKSTPGLPDDADPWEKPADWWKDERG
jgi:hypothetical protein